MSFVAFKGFFVCFFSDNACWCQSTLFIWRRVYCLLEVRWKILYTCWNKYVLPPAGRIFSALRSISILTCRCILCVIAHRHVILESAVLENSNYTQKRNIYEGVFDDFEQHFLINQPSVQSNQAHLLNTVLKLKKSISIFLLYTSTPWRFRGQYLMFASQIYQNMKYFTKRNW